MFKKKYVSVIAIGLIIISIMSGCNEESGVNENNVNNTIKVSPTVVVDNIKNNEQETDVELQEPVIASETGEEKTDEEQKEQIEINNAETLEYNGATYTIIEVDGGNRSGERQPNVAVDIGFGDRVYWALTNEYGQLIYVLADEITLQDDDSEPVTSDGRYYSDEAKVSGVEQDDLDEGHVIADSLGGVSNAYNITPQNSTLNRHGDQAYMERVMRDAGGCKNFVATITYPDNTTQIPSKYKYEYVLMGNEIVDEFDNVNPDEVNAAIEEQEQANSESVNEVGSNEGEDLSSVDTNGNGKVTIAEAKAGGYSMPIYSDHWLYQYMDDRDGDGMVGE